MASRARRQRVTPDALDAVAEAFQSSDYYADCLADGDCGATQTTDVLDRDEETLVLYSYWERSPVCVSVPHLALDYLGDGLLFDTRNEGRHYTWRIIHSGTGDVAAFFEALEAAVGDCAEMEMLRTGATEEAAGSVAAAGDLPAEQEAALQAAVEHGYYEQPREVDVGELAAHLDVARSTLTYRLRRAEEQLAKEFVADRPRPEASPNG
mgnify:CR=1 FL=1